VLLAAANAAAAGAVLTISDGVGVSCAEFFGHYCRMLGKGGPTLLPTRDAVALARGAAAAARMANRETEINEISILYLSRTGTYSIARARELLGYEPQVDLVEGMRRTEEWLRREGLLLPPRPQSTSWSWAPASSGWRRRASCSYAIRDARSPWSTRSSASAPTRPVITRASSMPASTTSPAR
jgi:hypothetical protein